MILFTCVEAKNDSRCHPGARVKVGEIDSCNLPFDLHTHCTHTFKTKGKQVYRPLMALDGIRE